MVKIQGIFTIAIEYNSSSMVERSPDGIKNNKKPIKKIGIPNMFLLNDGPILCKDMPAKNRKIPNQNCKSGNCM